MIEEERKTVLITGATSGIGEAFARRFANEGYNLIITGRRKEKIHSLANELMGKFKVNVEVFIVELSNADDIELLINHIKDKNIHILVNNAGFATKDVFVNENLDTQMQMVNVHIKCPMKLIHSILPKMIKRKNGSIINVSSLSAFMIIPRNATYSGTKAFLKSFSESLYLELINTGVKIQVLCPGFVKTDFHEKMGIEKSKQKNRGIIKWMSPQQIVDTSLNELKKGTLICKPGFWENLGMTMLTLLPKKVYYKIASNFGK